MKASLAGELLLLVGVLALAYLLWLQQGQLDELALELDRVLAGTGSSLPPVPVASDNGAEAVMPQAPPPKRARKPKASGA